MRLEVLAAGPLSPQMETRGGGPLQLLGEERPHCALHNQSKNKPPVSPYTSARTGEKNKV